MGRSTRLLKVLALAPAVVVSTVLTCLVGALLPPLAGLVLFAGGLTLTALLAAGALEKQAVRVLYGARELSPAEACALAPALTQLCQRGLGPPVVRLYVRPATRGVCSTPAGKKSVLVSGGLITRVQHGQLPHDQVAALMAGAVGHLMHRAFADHGLAGAPIARRP